MTATPSGNGYAVVAVDGAEEGDAAVAFAAGEALRHGLSLRLGHVMPAGIPVGPLETIAADHALGAYASETLAGAARIVADATPELEVTTTPSRVVGCRRSSSSPGTRVSSSSVGERPGPSIEPGPAERWTGSSAVPVARCTSCPSPLTARAVDRRRRRLQVDRALSGALRGCVPGRRRARGRSGRRPCLEAQRLLRRHHHPAGERGGDEPRPEGSDLGDDRAVAGCVSGGPGEGPRRS